VTAASLALFNPFVNPRVSFVALLPDVAVARYAGGGAKALADFSAVVAAKGALDGASWVQSSLIPGTSLSINATVSRQGSSLWLCSACLAGCILQYMAWCILQLVVKAPKAVLP
jgi:hypothetical protein